MSSSDFTEMANFSDEKVSSIRSTPPPPTSSDQEAPQTSVNRASWPKYKHFKDPHSESEAVYVLLDTADGPVRHRSVKSKGEEALRVCRQLLDLSSISLFVASNLLAFTVGLLIGKRSGEYWMEWFKINRK